MKTKKKAIIAVIALIVIGGGIELALRNFLGFCHAPLYYESNDFEYMARPNQDGMRFGNKYHYNSYSQRSDEPDSTRKIILGLGDSVLFGGVMIDQDSIATSLFSKETGKQMLNISAGSWGPDNCAAYLKKYGLFGAKAMFLVVSSHDAYDNMTFEKVVGKSVSYPDKQYWCAWAELFDRYLIPRLFKKKDKASPDQKVLDGSGIRKDGKVFNPGFAELDSMAEKAGIPLVVYLHADRDELASGKYNEQGQKIIQWANKNNVVLIKELDYHFTAQDYRDGIHMSCSGQRKLADIMEKYLKGIS